MTIEKAIKQYLASEHSTSLDNQLKRYSKLSSIETAINYACYGLLLDDKSIPQKDKDGESIYSDHYWNQYVQGFYGRKKLEYLSWIKSYIVSLKDEKKELISVKTFDELYDIVNIITKSHKGFGDLYSYDVTLRVCANLNKPQTELVYLQRGAKDGYKILFPKDTKIPRKVKKTKFEKLTNKFEPLSAYKIENLLCVAIQEGWI